MRFIGKWGIAAAIGAFLWRSGIESTTVEFWLWLTLFAALITAHQWAWKEPE
jgi:hypothetical protein